MSSEKALTYLAAYDDAALPRWRRRRLDALLARSADARRQLERQRAVRAAVGAFPQPAHAALRGEFAPARRRTTRRRPAAVLAIASVTGLLLVAALTLIPGSGPTVGAMAALAHSPVAQAAPPPDPTAPTLLSRRFAHIGFPNWAPRFGWMTQGARTDTVDGRRTSTVFYTHQGHRLAYTIVDGGPLKPPTRARRLTVHGVPIALYHDGAHTIVVFQRRGHTCVIAGHVLHEATILKLASWAGAGALTF